MEEIITTYVARLRGLANILFTHCTVEACTTILLTLINGLVDVYTKDEIRSKGKQMKLDKTVASWK